MSRSARASFLYHYTSPRHSHRNPQLVARLAASASPQTFSQRRRELGFPVANRLVAEHDAADQEHLRQITQGKLIAQAPEHHEGDDVAGVLRSVQDAGTPLVELLAAGATAEPAVTPGGPLAPFRNGC
jgi:hypothetical protein